MISILPFARGVLRCLTTPFRQLSCQSTPESKTRPPSLLNQYNEVAKWALSYIEELEADQEFAVKLLTRLHSRLGSREFISAGSEILPILPADTTPLEMASTSSTIASHTIPVGSYASVMAVKPATNGLNLINTGVIASSVVSISPASIIKPLLSGRLLSSMAARSPRSQRTPSSTGTIRSSVISISPSTPVTPTLSGFLPWESNATLFTPSSPAPSTISAPSSRGSDTQPTTTVVPKTSLSFLRNTSSGLDSSSTSLKDQPAAAQALRTSLSSLSIASLGSSSSSMRSKNKPAVDGVPTTFSSFNTTRSSGPTPYLKGPDSPPSAIAATKKLQFGSARIAPAKSRIPIPPPPSLQHFQFGCNISNLPPPPQLSHPNSTGFSFGRDFLQEAAVTSRALKATGVASAAPTTFGMEEEKVEDEGKRKEEKEKAKQVEKVEGKEEKGVEENLEEVHLFMGNEPNQPLVEQEPRLKLSRQERRALELKEKKERKREGNKGKDTA